MIVILLCVFHSLQEVRAAPLKIVSDLAFGDSWSSLFMDTLAPLGYIKVSIKTGLFFKA